MLQRNWSIPDSWISSSSSRRISISIGKFFRVQIAHSLTSIGRYPRHEHLYEVIRNNVIESGDFKQTIGDNERLVLGSRVILCTISMLSTARVMACGFTKIVPVQTVIIDEASQIEVGDYLPILARYKTTLRKMIFIGDDKQCM